MKASQDALQTQYPAMTQIYDSVFNLGLKPQAGWLYVAIVSFTRKGDPVAFPSVATLATMTRMSENSVRKYIKELVSVGLIAVTARAKGDGGQTSNLYTIINPSFVSHKTQNLEGGTSNSEGGLPQNLEGGTSNLEDEEQPMKNNQLKDGSATPDALLDFDWHGMTQAVVDVFGVRGKQQNHIANMLLGRSTTGTWKECNLTPAATPDEVRKFGAWFNRKMGGKDYQLRKAESIQSYFIEYRNAAKNGFTFTKEPAAYPNNPGDRPLGFGLKFVGGDE